LRSRFFLLAIFCCCYSLAAQDVIAPEKIPANLRHCNWLSRIGEPDSSLRLSQAMVDAAKRLGQPALIAEAQLERIRHFSAYQMRDSLEQCLDPLIAFAQKNALPKIQVEALCYHARLMLDLERFSAALQSCEQANDLARGLGDKRLTALGLLCKGLVMRTSLNDTRPPVPYFYQALSMFQELQDTANIIKAATLITSGEQDSLKKVALFQLASDLSDHYRNDPSRMSFLNFKASSLPAKEALILLQEALEISKRLRLPITEQHLNFQMVGRYIILRQFDHALESLDRAKAASPASIPEDLNLYYYEIYREQGNYALAVEYMEAHRELENEGKLKQTRSFVAEWETRMNMRETKWQLEQQQKEVANQRQLGLLLGLVLLLTLIAGGISVGAYYRQKKAREMLALQNETIRRQTEELQLLERLKSRFFANVSHELRTPLSLLLGPVNKLLKAGYWQKNDLKLLQMIQNNGKQLLSLVNEILDLSKLESGRLELNETAVNWLHWLQPSISQFSSYGESEFVKLHFDFQADPTLNVLIDARKCEKILHNFLSNAMKFTPAAGQVTLVAQDEGNSLLLSLNDTGPGIHPNDLPYVFDRFYQSKLPDLPAQGGTGIGLSLCRELAELMQGKVWVESVWGNGSTFYFRMPKKVAAAGLVKLDDQKSDNSIADNFDLQEHAPIVLKAGAGANADNPSQNAKLLIVEDNIELREFLKITLADYQVMVAENGKIATQLLSAQQVSPAAEPGEAFLPDLIISDLMMPVMDGFQFLEWIKSKDEFRHIPFIMLTARADIRVKLRALRIGVDDYLTKPFVEEELHARVVNLLEHHYVRMSHYTEATDNGSSGPSEGMPLMSEANAQWLAEVEALFFKKLDDKQFNLSWVAAEKFLSERQFRRRLQQLTGLSPNHYLREIRLQKAKDYLSQGNFFTVKEVSAAVGFSDTKYFSQLFLERFGLLPSAYQS
jgi:signal transduction histidine kinase/DNA-binding response OmpR family regulator